MLVQELSCNPMKLFGAWGTWRKALPVLHPSVVIYKEKGSRAYFVGSFIDCCGDILLHIVLVTNL